MGWGRVTAKLLGIREYPISLTRPAVAPFTLSYDRGQGIVWRARGQAGGGETRSLRFCTCSIRTGTQHPDCLWAPSLDFETWMKLQTGTRKPWQAYNAKDHFSLPEALANAHVRCALLCKSDLAFPSVI